MVETRGEPQIGSRYKRDSESPEILETTETTWAAKKPVDGADGQRLDSNNTFMA